MKNSLLFLNGDEIHQLLTYENKKIMNTVKSAYHAYSLGRAALPESTFLQFPDMERERIISLPAFLGEPFNCAGIKWISSFPKNINKNLERASAIFVLNSLQTGHPIAVMESSIISAKRTAAGAALTASLLIDDKEKIHTISIVGAGLINFETISFLLTDFTQVNQVNIYDIDEDRADQFKKVLSSQYPHITFTICKKLTAALASGQIVAFATSAIKPYITDVNTFKAGTVVLHTSLRDLAPEIILQSNNIVDDIHHATRANTSLHLASKKEPRLNFINATIGDLIEKGKKAFIFDDRAIIASPFGLGILDLALAQFIYHKALKKKTGTVINEFIPKPWFERLTQQNELTE